MTMTQEKKLLDACRLLFPTAVVDTSFLSYIQPEGLKNAYRNRAWEFHPDTSVSEHELHHRTVMFRNTVEAYKLLGSYLKERKTPLVSIRPTTRRGSTVTLAPPQPLAERNPEETYYEGDIPGFELKTGLYLYYRGEVSYQSVVRALLWQREMRPQLGNYARQWGWLNESEIELILRATDIVGSFGERAVELGLLSQSQLNLLLLQQRTSQQPLGAYFTQNRLLSESMLRRYLRELGDHNRSARTRRQHQESSIILP